MNARFFNLCILLSLLLPVSVAAQSKQAFNIRWYGTEDGLPANGIKGIQWDETSGFLWIATEAGISRFNGAEFKNYTRENTDYISAERMLFIVCNYRGIIYAADLLRKIFLIHKNKVIPVSGPTGSLNLVNKNLYQLAISEEFLKNKYQEKISQSINLIYDKVLAISDTSCLILRGPQLFFHSLNTSEPKRIAEQETFRTGFRLADQLFLLTANNQMLRYEPRQGKLLPAPVSGSTEIIPQSRVLWNHSSMEPVLLNGNKAAIFQVKDNQLSINLVCDSVPTDALIDFAQYSHKMKTLFLGTNSKGIIIISRNRVRPMKYKDKKASDHNAYYSQLLLPSGNILTNEGHILGDAKPNTAPAGLAGRIGFVISQSGDSLIWFTRVNPQTKRNNLHVYDRRNGSTKVFPKIAGPEWSVYQTPQQKILIGDIGLGVLEGDSMRILHRFEQSLQGTSAFDVVEMPGNKLVMATCVGLLQLDLNTNRIEKLFTAEGYCVRSLWKYKDYLFFGTYGKGFYALKNGVVKSMPHDKNNFLAYTHCFMNDSKGFCWISTNRGLFKASIEALVDYWENPNKNVYYHYLGKNDGMNITEMNGGCRPCAIRLANNTLSFPTMDGLLWVNPEIEDERMPEGDLSIDAFFADGKLINTDSVTGIQLSHTTQDITIVPSYAAWGNKENIYIEYQLNDTLNWKLLNTDKGAAIQFNNLPPGSYTLYIRKMNGFGPGNYTYVKQQFLIETPWYRQFWFYLLCIVAAGSLLWLIVRLRVRQLNAQARKLQRQVDQKTQELRQKNEVLEKNDTIKTRLISIISHDIVTPLKFLTVAGKNLLEKRSQMPDNLQQETIQEMANTSQELQLLSTNILNWIKYQNKNRRLAREQCNVYELTNQVFGVLKSIAKQKGIKLINDVPPNLVVQQYLEALKITIHNLVANAINFSEYGAITISSEISNAGVSITVSDEGVGMTPDQIQNILADEIIISSANIDNRKGNGLGYLIVKDLIQMMNAKLAIASEKGKGTRVSVQFGLEQNLPDQ